MRADIFEEKEETYVAKVNVLLDEDGDDEGEEPGKEQGFRRQA